MLLCGHGLFINWPLLINEMKISLVRSAETPYPLLLSAGAAPPGGSCVGMCYIQHPCAGGCTAPSCLVADWLLDP